MYQARNQGGSRGGLPDWPFFVAKLKSQTDHLRLRPPQFVVAKGHNNFKIIEKIFAASGRHSSLWPKATTFEKSQV